MKGIYEKGKYKAKIDGVHTEVYKIWYEMIRRCYHKNRQNYKFYGARGVKVSEDWLYFQNFAEWYKTSKMSVKSGVIYSVDKDLKLKGSDIYSPETCILLPKHFNNSFKDCEVKYSPRLNYKRFICRIPLDGKRLTTRGFYEERHARLLHNLLMDFKMSLIVDTLLANKLCSDFKYKATYIIDPDLPSLSIVAHEFLRCCEIITQHYESLMHNCFKVNLINNENNYVYKLVKEIS